MENAPDLLTMLMSVDETLIQMSRRRTHDEHNSTGTSNQASKNWRFDLVSLWRQDNAGRSQQAPVPLRRKAVGGSTTHTPSVRKDTPPHGGGALTGDDPRTDDSHHERSVGTPVGPTLTRSRSLVT